MALTARQALARTLLLTKQLRLPDVAEDEMVAALNSIGVSIVADESNLASPAAQAAVTTLAGLIFALGMPVRLVMPEVRVRGAQPPLQGSELRAGLIELGADSVPGAGTEVVTDPAPDDLVFLIGSTPWAGDNALAWRLAASGWTGRLMPAHEHAHVIDGQFPFGALAAAAAAAVEPYRAALRLATAQSGCRPLQASHLVPAENCIIDLAAPDTPIPSPNLGAVDFVSGGAITTAALHALYRIPGVEGRFRIWEPEALDGTNLNRYALMRRSMNETPKTRMLKHWAPEGATVETYETLVDADSIADVGAWAPVVVVGADNDLVRWLVQSTWPQWLGIAGTAGFMVIVSEHQQGQPCAGCLHAWKEEVPGDIPTICFVSYWAGLLLATRLLRYQVAGPVPLREQMTQAWPDRLDGELGLRSAPIQRQIDCRMGCR